MAVGATGIPNIASALRESTTTDTSPAPRGGGQSLSAIKPRSAGNRRTQPRAATQHETTLIEGAGRVIAGTTTERRGQSERIADDAEYEAASE